MSSTFYCDMDALTPQQRHRHGELAKELRPLVAEFREVTDGYVAELRSPRNLQSSIDEFMTLERLCCPFFELRMDSEHRGETERVYLISITGPGEIKPFIRAEFGIPENEDAA